MIESLHSRTIWHTARDSNVLSSYHTIVGIEAIDMQLIRMQTTRLSDACLALKTMQRDLFLNGCAKENMVFETNLHKLAQHQKCTKGLAYSIRRV